jgi:hypothetical protein
VEAKLHRQVVILDEVGNGDEVGRVPFLAHRFCCAGFPNRLDPTSVRSSKRSTFMVPIEVGKSRPYKL